MLHVISNPASGKKSYGLFLQHVNSKLDFSLRSQHSRPYGKMNVNQFTQFSTTYRDWHPDSVEVNL